MLLPYWAMAQVNTAQKVRHFSTEERGYLNLKEEKVKIMKNEASGAIVQNFGENSDIKVFFGSGAVWYLTRISKSLMIPTKTGETNEVIEVMNEKGERLELHLMKDRTVLIWDTPGLKDYIVWDK